MILVTGAAGYIGGEISLKLNDAGHKVVGIDRRPCPAHLSPVFGNNFLVRDFADPDALKWAAALKPKAIVHCAGTSLVGPSIADPQEYYHNNSIKTLALLDMMKESLPDTKFIFSSSAAVYGNPVNTPCLESDPCSPISPYGQSKLWIEHMLSSYRRAYGLNYVAFRYFNACGADSQSRHGQEPGATHIIARVLESIKHNSEFVLYGNNYPTDDGTCIRDYVHVEDIAQAHVRACEDDVESGVYNLGRNQGVSNLSLIGLCQTITNCTVKVRTSMRREGDPPVLCASDEKWSRMVGSWRKYDLIDMITHAWHWYNV
jgi:UDP-glucose 4-epimerase